MSSSREPTQPNELSLRELKALFAEHLRESNRLKPPQGIPTGLAALDRYLFWKGIPKGALSLFHGSLGTGSTSLWLEAASHSLRKGHWAAWINKEIPLFPLPLYHKGLDLEKLIFIDEPKTSERLFWLLQELMSSSLFDLIGCDLGRTRLKEHQLRKLQAQARQSEVALVFVSQRKPLSGSHMTVFSLIVHFKKRNITIERALHRPTPHSFSRSVSYARFTHHTADRLGADSAFAPTGNREQESDSLPEAPRTAVSRI